MLEVNKKFYNEFFFQFQTSLAFAKARHMPAINFNYVNWWDIKEDNPELPFDDVHHDYRIYSGIKDCFIDVKKLVENKINEIEKILAEGIRLNHLSKYYQCNIDAKLADTIKNHTCKIISTGYDCVYPLLVEVSVTIYLKDKEFLNNEDYQSYQTVALK